MKKIAVCLPQDLGGVVDSLPFLMELCECYADENKIEFSIICPKEYTELMEVIPYEIDIYPFDVDKEGSIPGVHKYAVNLKHVYNIDAFFTLPDEYYAALMGLCFRATDRVGYHHLFKKGTLTHAYEVPDTIPSSEKYLRLLDNYFEKKVSRKTITSRRTKPYYQDHAENRYFAVGITSKNNTKWLDPGWWADFFNDFDGERFVFLGSLKDEAYIHSVIEQLGDQNKYINLAGQTTFKEMISIMSYAQGSIAYSRGFGSVSALFKCPVLMFAQSDNDLPNFTVGKSIRFDRTSDRIVMVDRLYKLVDEVRFSGN
ncbi:MAG: glycosyltransferase family 9 protein [Bacteriovoracaceae bacterium]|jgi:ADP-heptose:LPS heptosyltransferase|nr:glycosyltransferase family 9 protein [Bacteriovoracaceae bacterium]